MGVNDHSALLHDDIEVQRDLLNRYAAAFACGSATRYRSYTWTDIPVYSLNG